MLKSKMIMIEVAAIQFSSSAGFAMGAGEGDAPVRGTISVPKGKIIDAYQGDKTFEHEGRKYK